MLRKAVSLAAVLRRDPSEFVDRVVAIAAGRLETVRGPDATYRALQWQEAQLELERVLGAAVAAAATERRLDRIERDTRERIARLRGGPLDDRHNGDTVFARCCYILARALRPRFVIETGVAHGVSTAFLLAALEENGAGELHSIDLPPHDHGAEDRIGACVPPDLHSRWHLHRGLSHRVLPALMTELPTVDLFVHDSQHTWRNMMFEFDIVWPHVRAIIADDIEQNGAFAAMARRAPAYAAAVRQATKPSLFGVLVR